MQPEEPLNVCVTGAAGQIAYSFIPQLLRGSAFGSRKINLRLLDIAQSMKTLQGVILEINDCAYSLLNSIEHGDTPEEMFQGADVIVFLGGFPRLKGMERKDLLQKNKDIFVTQSKALSAAKPTAVCVVVANPANTNAYILGQFCKSISPQNITCLSRLDHNRAISQIATETNSRPQDVDGIMVFGNHSTTQYPCLMHITVNGQKISELADEKWLKEVFIPKVQKRGGEILEVRGGSSVFSAANAVIDHLKDWYEGTGQRVVSMGVQSDGSYGIPKGLWSSMPVRCKKGFQYQIVKDFQMGDYCHQKINLSVKELQEEIADAKL